MVKFWAIILFSSCFLNISAQNTPILSKKEMYADFDSLVIKLKTVSPHIAIKKDLWNYDAFKQLKALRKEIDTVNSYHSFAILIERALNICQDYHTSIWSVPTESNQSRQINKLYLPISYFDGNYYLTSSIITKTDTIAIGSVITKVNELPIHEYVQKHMSDKVYNYDLANQRFYSNRFYRNLAVKKDGFIRLTAKSNNKEKQFKLLANDRVQYVRSIMQDSLRQMVEYWPNERVLYVKIFRMEANDIPYFLKKINDIKKQALEIKKVIIDIRDNQGGEDTVWMSVYQAILPKKIFHAQISGFNPSFMDSIYMEDHLLNFSTLKKNKNPILRKYHLYDYLNVTDSIMPSDSSLNVQGKFIVMGNENIYSAGASAMVIPNADHNDQIISLGRKTDLFIGTGFSPIVFELPISKIQYRIAPSIETYNVQQLKDLMQDNIEVEVPYFLDDFYAKEKFNGNALGNYFLQHFDSFIKIALKL